jgi:hypothetical protein
MPHIAVSHPVTNTTPCLAPNRAVIEFCYHTETEIDMDLWVSDSKESDEDETAL